MRPPGVGHLVKSVLVRSGTGLRPLLSVKVQALRARPILGVRCLLLLSEPWLSSLKKLSKLIPSRKIMSTSNIQSGTPSDTNLWAESLHIIAEQLSPHCARVISEGRKRYQLPAARPLQPDARCLPDPSLTLARRLIDRFSRRYASRISWCRAPESRPHCVEARPRRRTRASRGRGRGDGGAVR